MSFCKKWTAWALSLLLVTGLTVPAAASGEASTETSGEASAEASGEISIETSREEYPDGYFLPVFETSDIHGCLVDTAAQPYQYRVAYIADKVKDARGGADTYDQSRAVLLDSGDIYQGDVLSNLLDGVPITIAFDRMDYDAVSVGNHEFDWDVETMYDPDATMLSYTLDGDLLALSDASIALLGEALNANIGYVTVSIDRNPLGGNERSTTAGNWVTSMFARAVEADVGFYNGGGIRTDLRMPAGATELYVTVSDIYTMLPFGTGIYCYELTGSELLELLTFAVNGGSHLYSFMSGVDCYYTDGVINALVKDGEVIYQNGVWAEGWETKTLRVAAGEYISTSEDSRNLLYRLLDTEKLLSTDSVDNECSVAVLRAEAAESGGLLHVDTAPHFIQGVLS